MRCSLRYSPVEATPREVLGPAPDLPGMDVKLCSPRYVHLEVEIFGKKMGH
jgi:hypothetical protein